MRSSTLRPITVLAVAFIAAAQLSGCNSIATRTYAYAMPSAASTDTLGAVNAARKSQGRSAMRIDAKAQKAAERQARAMARANKMAHVLPGQIGFAKRMKRDGIDTVAAENVAWGQSDASAAVEAWMNSSGHRRNLLDKRFKGVGVASAKGNKGRLYWAMILVP